jgi:hypothetical protein
MKHPLCFFILTLCLVGCADHMYLYTPNAVHAPLLQEKDEVRVNLMPGDLQLAWSPVNHLGIMVNGQYMLRTRTKNSDGDVPFYDTHAKGRMLEAGVGYYRRYARTRHSAKVMEIYAGYGRGSYSTIASDYFDISASPRPSYDNYIIGTKMERFFIQPAFGVVDGRFDFSFAPRMSVLHFNHSDIGSEALLSDAAFRQDFEALSNKWLFATEPNFTIRFGYKYVRFMAQGQFFMPIGRFTQKKTPENAGTPYEGSQNIQKINVRLGASFYFSRWLARVK